MVERPPFCLPLCRYRSRSNSVVRVRKAQLRMKHNKVPGTPQIALQGKGLIEPGDVMVTWVCTVGGRRALLPHTGCCT